MKNTLEKVGRLSFIAGLVIVILLTFLPGVTTSVWWVTVLAVLGLIVGLLNIQDKEVTQFLVATIALMMAGGILANIHASLETFAFALVIFTAPAAALVAIKAIVTLGKK